MATRRPSWRNCSAATTGNDNDWHATEMAKDASGRFALALNGLASSFHYRVVAGARDVENLRGRRGSCSARHPHRRRVHLSAGPRSGAACRRGRRRHLRAGRHATCACWCTPICRRRRGGWCSAGDKTIDARRLAPNGVLRGSLQIVEDGAYRVALADAEGWPSRGDTEYFIRTLEDRPPEVHVVKPASDRRVTRLEEVDIEAEADDDFGIASLDLVYSVRGGAEKVVPLADPAARDVGHRPAHAVPRGSRRRAGRLRQLLRARARSGARQAIERGAQRHLLPRRETVRGGIHAGPEPGGDGRRPVQSAASTISWRRRKQIIVATWKLDRRDRRRRAAPSPNEDITVGRRAPRAS